MRLSRKLIEATYKQDKTAREQAVRAWNSLVRYIEKAKGDGYKDLKPHRSTAGLFLSGLDRMSGFPPGLGVILAPKRMQTGIGKSAGRDIIILAGALRDDFSTEKLDVIVKYGIGAKSDFVHEFIHYLDQQRYGARRVGNTAKYRDAVVGSGEIAQYFKTPQEFNAWFQQTAELVESLIVDAVRKARAKGNEFFLNYLKKQYWEFNDFLDYVKTINRSDEIIQAYKGTKWEKKWLKRMAELHRGIKAEFEVT